ncbi:hypothetical protein H8356DRAFT_1423888 [Neocallimastix lanati (nom. inval.)]|nr:hypothetical protein H8356DRAFT_1423888 [Neocallimastix sp. JGI-2020a]
MTPLHYNYKALLCIAIEKGYDAIISFLFEHGANIESENKNGIEDRANIESLQKRNLEIEEYILKMDVGVEIERIIVVLTE